MKKKDTLEAEIQTLIAVSKPVKTSNANEDQLNVN